jgi:tetratricopeptide (TPR) repeat protein
MFRLAQRPLIVLAFALLLCACQTQQRAVHVSESSGDRAAQLGNHRTAVEEYREVVDRRPGRWDVRVKLAESLLEVNEPELAREQLEVAYTARPTNAEILDLLATAMLRSGDVDAMARELRFKADESGNAADWFRLGVFLARAGDDDAAERALLTAARLDGGERVAFQKGLANFYRSVGDRAKALERWRMALYLAPEDEETINALRALGHVPGPTFALLPRERASDLPD